MLPRMLIGLALLTGCTESSAEKSASRAALEVTEAPVAERYVERQTGLALPLPAGVAVEVKHFDPTLPAYKFRHLLELGSPQGIAVIIEVWDNPTAQPLDAWFAENMAFLVNDETRVSQREVGVEKVRAIQLEQPRSPQAVSLAFAFFERGARVYRVSCIDSDAELGAFPRALYEQVLAQAEFDQAVSP